MALTIASLNVKGLRDNTKRREVFNWLRKKNYSAYMLQEVHCTENTNQVWSAEWGYQAIFMGGLTKTHQNSVKVVQEFSEKLDLVDVWRILHPDTSRFTWRQPHPKVHCRLDFFLVSQSTVNITTLADIVPGYKTDHSMTTLCLSLHSNLRGW